MTGERSFFYNGYMRKKITSSTDLVKYSENIYAFLNKYSRMPSYAEICKICNIKSKNTAYNLVKNLKAIGLLNIDTSGKIIPTKLKVLGYVSPLNTGPAKSINSPLKLLGLVEAGFPTPSEESLQDNVSLDDWIIDKREASFMLKVKGDSMKDAGILDGDMIIVERTTQARVGKIVVAEIDGDYTVKYIRKDSKGTYYLEPANKSFKNIYPKDKLQINAVVKAVVRKLN